MAFSFISYIEVKVPRGMYAPLSTSRMNHVYKKSAMT